MIYDDDIKSHIIQEALHSLASHVQYSIGDRKFGHELLEGDIFFECSGTRTSGNTPEKYHRQSDVYRYRCNLFWDTRDVISPIQLRAWPVYVDAKTGEFTEEGAEEITIIWPTEDERYENGE